MQDNTNPREDAMIVELEKIKNDIAEGRKPSRSVRELLRWFNAQRRGTGVVERIEAELEAADLRTDPHFTTTWIDAPVTFRRREATAPMPDAAQNADGEAVEGTQAAVRADMIHLVRMLEAANTGSIIKSYA